MLADGVVGLAGGVGLAEGATGDAAGVGDDVAVDDDEGVGVGVAGALTLSLPVHGFHTGIRAGWTKSATWVAPNTAS